MNGSQNCMLRSAAERPVESCPREACAFWEPGGAVIEAGCAIERLALDVRRPDVAAFLLELRERLELVREVKLVPDSDAKGWPR